MKQAIDELIPKLTVGDIISNAWQHTRGSKWAIWLPVLIISAISFALEIIENKFFHQNMLGPTAKLLSPAIMMIVQAFIFAPFITGAIMAGVLHLRKQPINSSTGFQYFSIWIPLGVAAIIISLIRDILILAAMLTPLATRGWSMSIAMILSAIVSALFIITPPAIADKNLSVLQGLRFSAKKTLKYLHKIIAIFIVNCLMVIVFVLPIIIATTLHKPILEIVAGVILLGFCIGMIWFLPYFLLCISGIYVKLADEA